MDNWLPSLITPTPAEGYELAIKLARVAVKKPSPMMTHGPACAATTKKTPMH